MMTVVLLLLILLIFGLVFWARRQPEPTPKPPMHSGSVYRPSARVPSHA